MKRLLLLLFAITVICGCRYAQVPCTVLVGTEKVSAVAISIPFKNDYRSEIPWFGKRPWNAELRASDYGCISLFGCVCALMPESFDNNIVDIQLTEEGYEVIWERKNVQSYSAQGSALPEAYKLTIEIDTESGNRALCCEPISIGDAISGSAGEMCQFVIFTMDGVLIKRLNENRFSYIKRPIKPLRSLEDERRVVPTKEDQVVLDYIDSHLDEIIRLFEQDRNGVSPE